MGMQGMFPANPVNEKGLFTLYFEFTGANGADPAVSSFQGPLINGITRSAEGVYVVDLVVKDAIQRVLYGSATVNNTTSGDSTQNTAAVFVDETATGGCTVKVVCYQGTTKDDLDATRIWVKLTCRASESACSYT